MKIVNLSLTNFKKIASNKVMEFNEDVNVLVGANNTGKTSVLQALALAFNLRLFDFNPNDAIYYLVKNGVCEIEVEFLFSSSEWEICFDLIKHNYPQENFSKFAKKISHQKIIKKLTLNVIKKQIQGKKHQILLSDIQDNVVADKQSLIQQALDNIKKVNFYDYFGSPLFIDSKQSISPEEQFQAIQSIRRENHPQQIRSKLYVIQKDDPEKFEAIKQHVLNVFPEIEDFTISHDEERAQFSLQLKEKIKKNGDFEKINYDIHNTGLGMQSLILIIANIFVQNSNVVLLDEPEIHMHPDLVKKFINIIQQISTEKQIILTTHSVPLINTVAPEKLFSLKYIAAEKGVIANPIKEKKEVINVLNDLGFDLDNEIFSKEPRSKTIVFVEGKTDKDYLMSFAKKFKTELGLSDAFDYPIFVEIGGSGDASKYAVVIDKLRNLEKQFMITIDQDEKNYTKLKNQLNESELHIWKKRQIENYLLDVKTLAKVLDKNEDIIKDQIEKIIDLQKEDAFHRFARELFSGWQLTIGMRELLDENKNKNFEEYESAVEKLVTNNLIDAKNKARKDVKNLQQFFDEKWEKNKWNLCDGKKVLRNFRQHYSFSYDDVIEAMDQCPEDIKNFWVKVIKNSAL
jgi:predicted ATPase